MSTRVRRTSFLFLLVAALIAAPAAAADDDQTFFYNITTDETWAAGMALGQASKALEAGYDVVLFLNVRGVYLAATERQQDTFAPTGHTAGEMLQAALEDGARVIICPMCMEKAGLTMDDLIEGVERGGPDVTFEVMAAEGTVVMSY